MEKKLFSIVIPTLNEEIFLPKLLNDLVAQKEKNFEVIIIDGNSTDATKQKALNFKKNLDLHFFTVTKRNVAYQRNYGAHKATGRYLIFFDADIRITTSFLKKLHSFIEKSKGVIFIPQCYSQDAFFQDKTIFAVFNMLIEASQITSKPFSLGGSLIFEKNYFRYLGGFNEKLYLAEDHEIVQRAKKNGITCVILKKIGVNVSLRRFKREGRIELLRKYLIATIHTIANGAIEKKLFDYKMGGHHYRGKIKTKTLESEIRNYFTDIKRIVTKLTND